MDDLFVEEVLDKNDVKENVKESLLKDEFFKNTIHESNVEIAREYLKNDLPGAELELKHFGKEEASAGEPYFLASQKFDPQDSESTLGDVVDSVELHNDGKFYGKDPRSDARMSWLIDFRIL